MNRREMRRTGVLVAGGGIAGCLAALEAARTGARTAMLLKGGPGRGSRGNTAVAGGGFAAALGHTDPSDSPQEHLRDMLVGGEFLNNQRLVRIMVEEALGRIRYLEELGVEFEHDARGYRQRLAPGHSHPRSVMVAGGRMGSMTQVLANKVKASGVEVHRGLTLTDVLVAEEEAVGASCVLEDGQQVEFHADAVILATGGLGQLYPVTSNPPFMTGDGCACGYRAGAHLQDMEFVQFTPAGVVFPDSMRGLSVNHELLAHPGVRIQDGRRHLIRVPGDGALRDLAFRLDLIRLFHRAILSGRGTSHGGLYLELCDVPDEAIRRLSPALSDAMERGSIRDAHQPLEIAPEVHFFMGGLEVNEAGETSVPGLYAVGETAGGCHGANRLTHNAFPEVIVFAPRAGKAAGERALSREGRRPPEPARLTSPGWSPAPDLRRTLQAMMLAAAGPIRTAGDLHAGIAKLQELRATTEGKGRADEGDPLEAHAVRNLMQVAELVLRSALRREESRGSHYREDHPTRRDPRWLINLVVERGPGGPQILEKPVDLSYLRPETA